MRLFDRSSCFKTDVGCARVNCERLSDNKNAVESVAMKIDLLTERCGSVNAERDGFLVALKNWKAKVS